jgi:secreted effector protein SseB
MSGTVMTPFWMSHPQPAVETGASSSSIDSPFDQDGLNSLQNNNSPFGRGILTMSQMMGLLYRFADQRMNEMETQMKVSENAQNMSNKMEAVIAKINDAVKDRTTIPDDVKQYLEKNGIAVDGKSIDDFIKDNTTTSDSGATGLDKAALMNVKTALENQSSQASNFVQTSQLRIQQVMQTYNIATQMTNSLQSMGAEMNKSIASSIR